MAVANRGLVKKVIRERGVQGCEMCGASKPNLASRGLHVCHVVSKKAKGTDEVDNLLALCPSCADAFDLVLKPKIWRALRPFSGCVPRNWKDAEGRRAKGDRV